ncbi:hypothetical protein HYH02_013048 [Chlamydomonas schloesseri]|uniref:RING-type domain-containing protein n=1 Tax=Chlamydomonas schloesseri TaxID=2026947 RepID=A0A835W061_9CHLO|nr:hypothetical protein HYH02_013048 [Chlamydomonas schloesseri]|eukprot:KAG2432328.1 hypothetical protein HYH02_013048 [Chlamydomonas schloesseri]
MGRHRRGPAYLEDEEYWDQEEEDYGDYDAYDEDAGHYEAPCATRAEDNNSHAAPEPVDDGALLNEQLNEDVCAICLGEIELVETAIIKGCEHQYCVNCILQWALQKEAPWCPQCKKPFNYLYTHRLLDGSLSDAPCEESVCLLKRATWFVEHVKSLNGGKAVSAAMAAAGDDWGGAGVDSPYYDEDDYDDDEDEQIENFYFSRAAGPARIVIGNRRLGENGFQRAGRIYARPTHNNHNNNNQQASSSTTASASAAASSAPVGNGIGKAGKVRAGGNSNKIAPRLVRGGAGSAAGGSSPLGTSPSAGGGMGPLAAGGAGGVSSAAAAAATPSAPGQGRRAKRNARRAAADMAVLSLDD